MTAILHAAAELETISERSRTVASAISQTLAAEGFERVSVPGVQGAGAAFILKAPADGLYVDRQYEIIVREISSEPATGPFMVQVEVDKEYVANAIVGFVENGYSQWCSEFKPDETHAPTCAILQTLRERKANIWYSEVQFWTAGGQAVAVFDEPSEDEGSMTGRKVVDLEVLHQGLRLMSEKSPKHFADLVNENDDADTHDTFAQYAILGDVVYG